MLVRGQNARATSMKLFDRVCRSNGTLVGNLVLPKLDRPYTQVEIESCVFPAYMEFSIKPEMIFHGYSAIIMALPNVKLILLCRYRWINVLPLWHLNITKK